MEERNIHIPIVIVIVIVIGWDMLLFPTMTNLLTTRYSIE